MHRLLELLCLGLMVSCINDSGQNNLPGDYSDYTRVPLQSEIRGVQPMTGIVIWSDSAGSHNESYALEYSYMRYNDICKNKDEYDWSPVEKLLSQAASRGHQTVLRFYYVYVGKQCTVPDYIKALPDYEETSGRSEGRMTYFPDWRNAELQRFHLDFYRRFAEKFDKDPRLAFLETGFGLWAEYHIYEGPFIKGKTFPSMEFQAEFFRGMQKWFIHTPWMISIDAADSKYGPFRQDPSLLDIPFGNFDDSFMCEDHDGYNRRSWQFFGEERYKTSPFGGEFSYYTDYDQKHCIDKEGMYGRTFEDEVARYHMTFIIGNDQPRYQSWERIAEASRSMGYSFRIKDFRVLQGKGAAVEIENSGVAPIYHDAYVEVDGVRGSYNLKALLPGESVWVEIPNRSVSASPQLSIACERLVDGQKIMFEADIR
ncbi:MAG: DUF4832 domain-containing protein [Bacteroidales bacterium]|nr:DUF4832 domain-containing protein [Bacteroidales bacterium]